MRSLLMGPNPRLVAVLAVFLALAGAGDLRAQEQLSRLNYSNFPGTEVTITSVFSRFPSCGYLPLRVTLKNTSAKDRSFLLGFTSHGNAQKTLSLQSNFRLACGAQSEVEHEILLPLAPMLDESSRQEIRINVLANGLPRRTDLAYGEFSRDWPALAISKGLLVGNILPKLDDKVKKSSGQSYYNEVFGAEYAPNQLPDDWRGLSGLDALLITDKEWQRLAPGRKQSVQQWLRLGGQLHVYATDDRVTLASLGLSEPGGTGGKPAKQTAGSRPRAEHSFGLVDLHRWNGKSLDVDQTYLDYKSIKRFSRRLAQGFVSNWGLREEFGTRSFNQGLILAVLLIFGILVGPVNLWVLAGPGRRHRLFVTTPIISLSASLVMAALIYLKDGVGGDGLRFTVMNLEPGPDERKSYVFQEQFARTGLLLGRGFTLDDDAFLNPVTLRSSPWSQFDDDQSRRNALQVEGRQYGSGWFRSRSETGHQMRTVRSTRARIERITGGAAATTDSSDPPQPPRLFSSLGFDVELLYYVDAGGKVWKSSDKVTTGSEIALDTAARAELTAWWREQADPGSRDFRERLNALTNRRELFFAITTDPAAGVPATGDFIRWKSKPVLVFGSLMDVSRPTPPQS